MKILSTAEELHKALHFRCSCCHKVKPVQKEGGTGYGYDEDDQPVCYTCCGEKDRQHMIETGKAVLYLSYHKGGTQHGNFPFDKQPVSPLWTVSNWPGSLKISAYVRKGSHNIARTRYDVWFTGPDGKQWHGVQIGENTQICRCKRLKK